MACLTLDSRAHENVDLLVHLLVKRMRKRREFVVLDACHLLAVGKHGRTAPPPIRVVLVYQISLLVLLFNPSRL